MGQYYMSCQNGLLSICSQDEKSFCYVCVVLLSISSYFHLSFSLTHLSTCLFVPYAESPILITSDLSRSLTRVLVVYTALNTLCKSQLFNSLCASVSPLTSSPSSNSQQMSTPDSNMSFYAPTLSPGVTPRFSTTPSPRTATVSTAPAAGQSPAITVLCRVRPPLVNEARAVTGVTIEENSLLVKQKNEVSETVFALRVLCHSLRQQRQ